MLTGENGILTKANKAKEEYAYKNAEEKVKLAVLEYQVKMREESLYRILSKIEGLEEIDPDSEIGGPPYIVVVDGYEFEVKIDEETEDLKVEYKGKSSGIIPEIIKAEKVINGEEVKILVEAKTEDEQGMKKIILIKNGVEIETKEVEGKNVKGEFLLKGNGKYRVKVVAKNRKKAESGEIAVTEVKTTVSGTLKAGTVKDGSVLLTVNGEATGESIAKVEIYRQETIKIADIPCEGEKMQIETKHETGINDMPFYEETVYIAKIQTSTGEAAWTNTVTCQNLEAIRTRQDLDNLSTAVAEGNSVNQKEIKVMNDIDLGSKPFTPIGSYNCPFNGTFNGQFHTISNLKNADFEYIEGWNTTGLFGYVNKNGRIKGVILSNVKVDGNRGGFSNRKNIGALVGECEGIIWQCGVNSGSVSFTKGEQLINIGGLCGSVPSGGRIYACYNRANVTATVSDIDWNCVRWNRRLYRS